MKRCLCSVSQRYSGPNAAHLLQLYWKSFVLYWKPSHLFMSGLGPVMSHLWDDEASGFHQKDITGCPLNRSGRVKGVKWFGGEPHVLHKFHGLCTHFIFPVPLKTYSSVPDLNQRDSDTHDQSQIQHKPQEKKMKEDQGNMNNKVCCIFRFLEEDWKLDRKKRIESNENWNNWKYRKKLNNLDLKKKKKKLWRTA